MKIFGNGFRRATAVPLIVAALAVTIMVPVSPASADPWVPPVFERLIGGWGHAGVYAWGMNFNPVTNEVVASDYNNYEVRKYDPTTGKENVAFFRPVAQRNGQPYSVAVQPGTGDMYVSEIGDGQTSGIVAVYDKNGTYKFELRMREVRYDAYTTFDDEGYLWVSDAHYWSSPTNPGMMRRYQVGEGVSCNNSTNACQVSSFGTYGNDPGQLNTPRGVAFDGDGNMWIADGGANRLVKVAPDGTELGRYGTPGTGTGAGQLAGDIRGVAIDRARNAVYVVDATGGQVEKFNLTTGAPVSNFGAIGAGPGQFRDGGRQVTVNPANGDVWAADFGGYRIMRWTSTGSYVGAYPNPERPRPLGGFNQVRGMAVDQSTGAIYTTEVYNFRVQKFAADGTFQGAWGDRGSDPPYGFDYPRGIGIDPATHEIWVANTRSHNIRVYDQNMNFLRTVGNGIDSTDPGSFRWPDGVEFWNGRAIVSDYNSSRVKVLDAATGAELFAISRTNNEVAINPDNGDIYVAGNTDIRVYDMNGVYLRRFGTRGSGDGQFRNLWDVDIHNGLLYASDTTRNDIQVLNLDGTFVGKFGTPGWLPTQMQGPSGIDFDAQGNIYISDFGNDRVLKYSWTQTAPSGDTTAPTVTRAAPANGATVPAGLIDVTGTASDDQQVAKTEVAILRTGSGMWWDARTSAWSTAKKWNLALGTGPVASMNWKLPFVGSDPAASYTVQARVTDVAGNVSSVNQTTFSTSAGGGDNVAPDAAVTVPTANQSFPAGPINFAGTATDNVGVGAVRVAIQRTTDNLWWRGGTTWGAYQQQLVTLPSPGATSTPWTYQWASPAAGGSYRLEVQAQDTAGNFDPTKPLVPFTVVGDTVAPDGTVTVPALNQVLVLGPLTLTGDATDNVGVDSVYVALQRKSDNLWLRIDGTWGQYQQRPVTLASPGATATGWSWNWTPTEAGAYSLQVEARDYAGNKDATKAWANFSVA